MRQITNVHIFFCGDDSLDKELAHEIAQGIGCFDESCLHDVDDLRRLDEQAGKRQERFKGIPIYILSHSILEKLDNRQSLAYASTMLGVLTIAFFVCRGITREQITNEYPELEELCDKIMIGEIRNEEDTKEIICELVEEVKNSLELIPGIIKQKRDLSRKLKSRFPLSLIILFLAFLLSPVGYIGLLAVFPLICFQIGVLSISAELIHGAYFLVLYSFGFNLNRVPALDFWPWLGAQWKHSIGSDSDLYRAIAAWQRVRQRTCLLHGAQMLCTMEAILIMAEHSSFLFTSGGIVTFSMGLAFPPLYYWATDWIRKSAYWNIGLTEKELARTFDFFGPTTGGELKQSSWSWMVHRSWAQRKDNVFISYAWADNEFMKNQGLIPTPIQLANVLDELEIPYFLDTRRIEGRFAVWRPQVAGALLECTHLFLVIGPEVLKGEVIQREIELSRQRWHTEVFPSIICVVDPDVKERLLDDKNTPTRLKFTLDSCPQISHTELFFPDTVHQIIRQRRRQGLLNDWLAAMFPKSYLRRWLWENLH